MIGECVDDRRTKHSPKEEYNGTKGGFRFGAPGVPSLIKFKGTFEGASKQSMDPKNSIVLWCPKFLDPPLSRTLWSKNK